MPVVTIEDLLRLALPSGTVVVAGEAGLEREASWPALLRSRPPAFDPLRGGEIALVSMQAARLLDERLTLPRIMRSLTEMGVAAVAVAGEVDDEAKQLADAAGVPLLALPPGTNLRRIEQSITRAVIDRRSELYQRSQQIYQQLTELVIAGRGVPSIIERLSELTGRSVALEDEGLNLRVYASQSREIGREQVARCLEEGRGELRDWVRTIVPNASDPPTGMFVLAGLGLSRLVAPVVSRERAAGYLSILGRNGELGELERLTASRGAAACAIEIVKEWAVLEAEDRMQVDLIDDLLSGEFTSADALANRAKRLGFDINRPYAVIVFEISQNASHSAYRNSIEKGLTGGTAIAVGAFALDKLLERELVGHGLAALIGAKGDVVTVLYPCSRGTEPAAIKAIVGELVRSLSAQCGFAVTAGIGCLQPGLEGMRAAYREAQQSLAMGGRIFGPGSVTFFGDLGIYRLLFSVKDQRDLQVFLDQTLSKLVAYDGRSDGELVKTLEAYFACHASPTDAARKLHLHRNTLLYRLRRIQEITGLDLDDAETCLSLHLALRVKDVVRAMPS